MIWFLDDEWIQIISNYSCMVAGGALVEEKRRFARESLCGVPGLPLAKGYDLVRACIV